MWATLYTWISNDNFPALKLQYYNILHIMTHINMANLLTYLYIKYKLLKNWFWSNCWIVQTKTSQQNKKKIKP